MIVVDKVAKYYGTHPAVENLSFEIGEGECVGFLGLNGAGKTTTLRILSCLLLPTTGRVTIRGLDAEAEPHEIRKFIGFLPDTPPLYDEMTVEHFLAFAGRLRKMSAPEVRRRLPQVIGEAGLEAVADQPIATLSHGYRQRVGIAQAIIHQPALLILDEPIKGLDPVQIVEMRELIRGLHGKHTILLSSHILSEIEQTCDRILMLNQGRIAAQGTEEELGARFASDVRISVEVRLASTGVEDIEQTLKKLESVNSVSSKHGATESGVRSEDVWTVEVMASEDVRERIASELVKSGAGLLHLERLDDDLESIFVNLSRSDESGSRPRPATASAVAKPQGDRAPNESDGSETKKASEAQPEGGAA